MRPLLLALAATLLAGCATGTIRQSDSVTDSRVADADLVLGSMRAGTPTTRAGELKVLNDATFVAPKPRDLDQGRTLPTACPITFSPASSATLLEFGQTVSKVCGIQVRVTPDALAVTGGGGYRGGDDMPSSAADAVSDIPMPPGVTLPASLSGGRSAGSYRSEVSPHRIDIRYEGELTGLLDAVTARLGLSWRYADGVITVFYLDTRFFKVFSIPTTSEFGAVVTSGSSTAAGVAGGSGGGSSGGGSEGGTSGSASSSQSTNVSLRTNATADLIASVQSMLTPEVGRMSHSAYSGTLTVTDRPEVLDRVGRYVDDLNSFATKQVLLNIKVLSVTLDNADEWGINWNAIYTNLADTYGLGLVGGFTPSADAISGSVNILQGNSRFSGSNLIVDALARQGRVSVITQPSVTTMNLEPVPVQVGDTDGYVAQTITTLTGGDGDFAQTSRVTGTITTGFNMNLLPFVLPDDETVLLQFSMQIGALKRLRSVGDDDNLVEIPDTSSRNLSQKVKLRSGETLVLSGFDQTENSTERTGVGSPRFWLFGGGAKGASTREVLVVLITPVVMG